MALQFILGASGAGKSTYIYKKLIDEAMQNMTTNYMLLVPEQYSLALQKKMVEMHPNKGAMNIDVIGFNRLNYRVFDELSIKPQKILEDFGKSMLIRQVAGNIKDELVMYNNCLDKNGFIDEVKSLMSELYQYDIDKERLCEVMGELCASGENELLCSKLYDMISIFKAFEEKIKDNYIVAEQLSELLADNIDKSALIKKSVIVMDGFTGFTPIQLKIIEKLLVNAQDVYITLTIDRYFYEKKYVGNHELFYLTRQTMDNLRRLCDKVSMAVKEDVFIEGNEVCRWKNNACETNYDMIFLEKNIFRYPYKKYQADVNNIQINTYDNTKTEIEGIAATIRNLVRYENYRFRDIAVISGKLDEDVLHIKQIFGKYDIPVFLDVKIPLKNNAWIDAIGHLLRIIEDNFSYDSVFAFLKCGLLKELTVDELEELENYVLARGIRGFSWWNKEWKNVCEDTREYVMGILAPFREKLKKSKNRISDYVNALRDIMSELEYERLLEDNMRLYTSVCEILEKLESIMPEDLVSVAEFKEILDIGMKDISLGMIPAGLDQVIVGDITRTRLDDIKVLFIIGINDGIIPKQGSNTQIISDNDKEELALYGINMAPTDKQNSYIELFYMYNNMTKPSEKLYLSYTQKSNGGDMLRPSFIISRVKKVFPGLVEKHHKNSFCVTTKEGSLTSLITGIRELIDGNYENESRTLSLFKLYYDQGEISVLDNICNAFDYNNIPGRLADDVRKLVELKTISQSVSRIEKYANCAYSYFLRYTLELKDRERNDVDSRVIGNVLHNALEKVYRHVHDNLNNDWESLSPKDRDSIVDNYIFQTFDALYDNEGRNGYLRASLARIGRRTAKMLCDITVRDGLEPSYFEYNFNREIMLSDGKKVGLYGIVDRADVYFSESEKMLKLRIIDYKSGNHDFEIGKVYDGLSLQLAIYMNVMQELVDNMDCKKNDAKLVPDGMYYYHLDDPYVEAKDEDDAEKKREKELKLKGLDYSDPMRFNDAVNYSMKKATAIIEQMLDGIIDKNPIKSGDKTPCEYCEFKSICRFDDKCGNNKYRYPTFAKKDKDKTYEAIRKELGGAADGLD